MADPLSLDLMLKNRFRFDIEGTDPLFAARRTVEVLETEHELVVTFYEDKEQNVLKWINTFTRDWDISAKLTIFKDSEEIISTTSYLLKYENHERHFSYRENDCVTIKVRFGKILEG